jgi:hypothetical protein
VEPKALRKLREFFNNFTYPSWLAWATCIHSQK